MYTNREDRGSALGLYVIDSIKSYELKYRMQYKAALLCEIKLQEQNKLVIWVIYRVIQHVE